MEENSKSVEKAMSIATDKVVELLVEWLLQIVCMNRFANSRLWKVWCAERAKEIVKQFNFAV